MWLQDQKARYIFKEVISWTLYLYTKLSFTSFDKPRLYSMPSAMKLGPAAKLNAGCFPISFVYSLVIRDSLSWQSYLTGIANIYRETFCLLTIRAATRCFHGECSLLLPNNSPYEAHYSNVKKDDFNYSPSHRASFNRVI